MGHSRGKSKAREMVDVSLLVRPQGDNWRVCDRIVLFDEQPHVAEVRSAP